MTRLVAIFVFISAFAAAQTPAKVQAYVRTIDSLRRSHCLTAVKYPQMSYCGGAVKGYYFGGKLVYISSVYGAELGYSGRDVYVKDTIPYKIIYREYFADWERHDRIYPHEDELIARHMTYTDTLYTIFLGESPRIYKTSRKKLVSKTMPDDLLLSLQECAGIMRRELESEKNKK